MSHHREIVNRLNACPQSHVYRAAQRRTHVLRAGRAGPTQQTALGGTETSSADETDEETSEWHVPPFLTGPTRRSSDDASAGRMHSGVTTALETAEAEMYASPSDSDSLPDYEPEQHPAPTEPTAAAPEHPSDSDEPIPEVGPRRSSRVRRLPARFRDLYPH